MQEFKAPGSGRNFKHELLKPRSRPHRVSSRGPRPLGSDAALVDAGSASPRGKDALASFSLFSDSLSSLSLLSLSLSLYSLLCSSLLLYG